MKRCYCVSLYSVLRWWWWKNAFLYDTKKDLLEFSSVWQRCRAISLFFGCWIRRRYFSPSFSGCSLFSIFHIVVVLFPLETVVVFFDEDCKRCLVPFLTYRCELIPNRRYLRSDYPYYLEQYLLLLLIKNAVAPWMQTLKSWECLSSFSVVGSFLFLPTRGPSGSFSSRFNSTHFSFFVSIPVDVDSFTFFSPYVKRSERLSASLLPSSFFFRRFWFCNGYFPGSRFRNKKRSQCFWLKYKECLPQRDRTTFPLQRQIKGKHFLFICAVRFIPRTYFFILFFVLSDCSKITTQTITSPKDISFYKILFLFIFDIISLLLELLQIW